MRRLALALVCLLLAPFSAPRAADSIANHYAAGSAETIGPTAFNPAKPHSLAYAPAEEPEWLAGMLKQGLPYGVVRQHVLFRWKGEPAWLAVTTDDGRKQKVSLFRITGPGKGYQELFLSATSLAIIEPSGSDFFHDGAPILALRHDEAGFPTEFGVVILHLADIVTEAAAAGYPLIGISPDGRFAVSYSLPEDDDETCHPCLVTALLALRWDGHGFKEACKDVPQLYDEPDLEEWLREKMQDNNAVNALRADIEWALLKLQKGNFREAAKIYREAKLRHLKNNRGIPKISLSLDKLFLSPSRRQTACPVPAKAPKELDLMFRESARITTSSPPLFHPPER